MSPALGAILLVAGTCIGSGMIALPMILAKIGLIPSLVLMGLMWILMYYTSLMHLELNLHAPRGMSLGGLGRHFSGPVCGFLGDFSFILLSYALLAVFIAGGSSVIQKMMGNPKDSLLHIQIGFSCVSVMLFLLPLPLMDFLNRILFFGLLGIVSFLILLLLVTIEWDQLPLWAPDSYSFSALQATLPILLTSFGFQVIFQTLTEYCHRDPKILKKVFFWGSLIPALVYMGWTLGILGALHMHHPEFYGQMTRESVEVGDLILQMSRITQWSLLEKAICWISLLAIVTSLIGVGRGLYDSWALYGERMSWGSWAFRHKRLLHRFLIACLTVIPSFLLASLVPNAFLRIFRFSGLILSMIAIFIPFFLLMKRILQGKNEKMFYPSVYKKGFLCVSFGCGVLIVLAEWMT